MPPRPQTDALRGSLDLLILKTLSLAPMHGWGISQRVQQISDGVLEVNQGSLYPALQRLEKNGLDHERLGHDRQQSPRAVLPTHRRRTPRARRRARQLAPLRDRPRGRAGSLHLTGDVRAAAPHDPEHSMSWFYAARARAASPRRAAPPSPASDEEFRFHIDMETQRLVREQRLDRRRSASSRHRRPSAACTQHRGIAPRRPRHRLARRHVARPEARLPNAREVSRPHAHRRTRDGVRHLVRRCHLRDVRHDHDHQAAAARTAIAS